jgi:hypothetical protein
MRPPRVGRRSFIGGTTGLLAGLAGCGERGQTGTDGGPGTQQTDGQPPGQGPDGQRPDGQSPDLTAVLGPLLDGAVVPVATGMDSVSPVDPAETPTPVGDAVARIDESGENDGFGVVILPPTTISEAEPVIPSHYVQFIGYGVNTSGIEFTNLERDGFRVTRPEEGKFVALDGFTVSGTDREARTDGSAIHFVNDSGRSPKQFNIGDLAFRDWVDPVVHCERGSPFDSTWHHLDFGYDANDGREIVLEREQSLLGTQIGYIGAGNATRDPVLYTNFAGAKIDIGFLNIGGTAGQAARIKSSKNGYVHIGGINFEPVLTTDRPIVSLQGRAPARIDYVQNTNSEARSMVQLNSDNGNKIIGPLRNNGTLQVGKIEVRRDSSLPSYYFGPPADVVSASNVSANLQTFGGSAQLTEQGGADRRMSAASVTQYSNASAAEVSAGELAVDTERGEDGTVALLFKDESGALHSWDADRL